MLPNDESESASVVFPDLREQLKYATRALSDEPFQISAWVNGIMPFANYGFSFDDALNVVLTDVPVAAWGKEAIGDVLTSLREYEAMSELTNACVALVLDIGQFGTIEDARRSGAWREVVRAAQAATHAIGQPRSFP
jgi:hypothetical protein